jgi:hypothetical protein
VACEGERDECRCGTPWSLQLFHGGGCWEVEDAQTMLACGGDGGETMGLLQEEEAVGGG